MSVSELSDIRDTRTLSSQAQQIADRYAAVQELRYQRFLGVRFIAAPPRAVRGTAKLVAVPDAGQRVA